MTYNIQDVLFIYFYLDKIHGCLEYHPSKSRKQVCKYYYHRLQAHIIYSNNENNKQKSLDYAVKEAQHVHACIIICVTLVEV